MPRTSKRCASTAKYSKTTGKQQAGAHLQLIQWLLIAMHLPFVQVDALAILQHCRKRVAANFKYIQQLHHPWMLHIAVDRVLPRDVADVGLLALLGPLVVELVHLDGYLAEFDEVQGLPYFGEAAAAQ